MVKEENNLIGKTVMSKEGFVVGIIKDSLTDKDTGKISTLLVTPAKEINLSAFKQNDKGEIIFPSDCVSTVRDIAVLE